ncbi:MAG TPA: class I SAM-dependent methyltransferase [Burkholderiaceae bacterium]
MSQPNYLPEVKEHYERLPYPTVDPQDEKKRLARTWLEQLPMVNHYCFRGRQKFDGGFRALVAGGGTGNATIFLAEQLRHTDAQIVHLDLSRASIAVAQERARIRGLSNIRWIEDSLLNLPALDLGQFDYINCDGVLHHLLDPDAGLRALRSVLKADGAMALMVYGSIGRTGVYQMQRLLRLANQDAGVDLKLAHAKEILADLPPMNWYRLGADLYNDHKMGDAGIYDALLHSQDRAYTVTELYEWLEDGHGLHLALSDIHRGRFPYLPEMTLPLEAPHLRKRLPGMSQRDRYAMSELLMGDLTRHHLYATRGDAAAPYGDADYIPFFFNEPLTGPSLEPMFTPKDGQPVFLQHPFLGLKVAVQAGRYAGTVLRHIDGQRTFAQIFELVRADPRHRAAPPGDTALFADFRSTYEALNAIERMLLRHVSCR